MTDEKLREEVAKEIFDDIKKTYPGIRWEYNQPKWHALISKYTGNALKSGKGEG
jgi:hypothetical protein